MTGDPLAAPPGAANGITRAEEKLSASAAPEYVAADVLPDAFLDWCNFPHEGRISPAYSVQEG